MKKTLTLGFIISFLLIASTFMLSNSTSKQPNNNVVQSFAVQSSVDYYASPNGTGNGLSQHTPFTVDKFWNLSKPGDTLNLLDGVYKGPKSMINPPSNLSGTSNNPITIKAVNDGKVIIDGEDVRTPIALNTNNNFVVEGLNAHNSSKTVVGISRSNNCIIRRVIGWNASDGNTNIFGIHYSTNTLIEDCAGWGIARKIFSSSQGGNHTTLRRCWGRWEGSHVVGPKMTYTLVYNNRNMIIENCIGTWSAEKMKQTYVLQGYNSKPWRGKNGDKAERTYSNYNVEEPYSIFGMDAINSWYSQDLNVNSKILGCIAYVDKNTKYDPSRLYLVSKLESIEYKDNVAYIEPGNNDNKISFQLNSLSGGSGNNLQAHNLTGISRSPAQIHQAWNSANILEAPDINTAYSSPENIFNSSRGANICKRYVDGVLTSDPLWPWPMNQRIIDAMVEGGYAPVDVTNTIEKMFGPIINTCDSCQTRLDSLIADNNILNNTKTSLTEKISTLQGTNNLLNQQITTYRTQMISIANAYTTLQKDKMGLLQTISTLKKNNTDLQSQIDQLKINCQPSTISKADFDKDGDVDANDFLTFSNCLSGSSQPIKTGCKIADLDLDGDVDNNDFLTFSNCFNGPLNPPKCLP